VGVKLKCALQKAALPSLSKTAERQGQVLLTPP
jgi:hypothetical protein